MQDKKTLFDSKLKEYLQKISKDIDKLGYDKIKLMTRYRKFAQEKYDFDSDTQTLIAFIGWVDSFLLRMHDIEPGPEALFELGCTEFITHGIAFQFGYLTAIAQHFPEKFAEPDDPLGNIERSNERVPKDAKIN